jgi:hypothetical protein
MTYFHIIELDLQVIWSSKITCKKWHTT